MKNYFKGATVRDGELRYLRDKGSVAGAHARVETSGEIQSRVTATRLLTTGVFAFALKKKKDDRTVFLTVESPAVSFVIEVKPKDEADARRFAAEVNSAAAKVLSV